MIIDGEDRDVVASCTYKARTFGVRSSIPIQMALRLCPQAKVMEGHETGLPISFALSVNKTVSKIGNGEAKPKGNLEIAENKVRSFFNPLSIQKIPTVGDVRFQLLSRIFNKHL